MISFFEHFYNDPVLRWELFFIGSVFLIQIMFFIKTRKDISVFKNTFSEKLTVTSKQRDIISLSEYEYEDDNSQNSILNVTQLSSSSKNPIHLRIKDSINNYLLHNFGATVNYSIIKDIIEREIETKNEEIAQYIPIPLYLGLSATIIGIIFGLIAMPDFAPSVIEGDTAENIGMEAIGPLINGVKIAMFATLSGLLWTIILSSFIYSRGLKKVSEEKNQQLNYLQEILLPELFKAEDAGVVGLKSSIDNFSRLSTDIVKELQIATVNSKENIISQQETLDRIEKLNVTKISKVNLELFDRLDKNMDSFLKFSEFLDRMEVISDNLRSFSMKANSIDEIAREINSNIKESRELTQFLTTHLQKIEKMGDGALYSVDMAEKGFKDAIEKLSETSENNIEQIGSISDQIEIKFNEIYENLFKKLDEVTKLYIDELTTVYSDAVPRFESLDHLSHLEQINSHLEKASNGTVTSIPEINEKMNQLELANKRLAQMSALLNSVEKNTKNLKGIKVTERSGLSKVLRDFMEWVKSLFGR